MGFVVLRDRSAPTRFPDNILHLVCDVRGSGCAVHRGLKKGGREPWSFLYALFLSLFSVKGVSDFHRYSNAPPAVRTGQNPWFSCYVEIPEWAIAQTPTEPAILRC